MELVEVVSIFGIIIAIIIFSMLLTIIFVKIIKFNSLNFNPLRSQLGELIDNKFFMSSDNYKLKWYGAITKQSKVIVLCIHDLLTTGEWFKELFINVISNDIDVVSWDQRGLNKNKEELYPNFGANLCDLNEIIDWIEERYPAKKIVLLGEGIGANLAILAQKKHKINGIILSSIITKNGYTTNAKNRHLIAKGMFLSSNIKIKKQEDGYDVITDKTFAKKINEYYFNNNSLSVREYFQIKFLKNSSYRNADLIKTNDLKGLILIPQNDIYFDDNKMTKIASKSGLTDNVIIYPKLKHFLFNEPDNKKVFQDILKFLEQFL
ncbi:alpha/beta hydrolase [Spiroplasma endosymbiont of Labia minor]|uniref:alpha/beta hydrolase n=1 Tax=Spiroplasma endosymbiont of Labia minor TaxID=3066305 RepID=UPI0030D189FD